MADCAYEYTSFSIVVCPYHRYFLIDARKFAHIESFINGCHMILHLIKIIVFQSVCHRCQYRNVRIHLFCIRKYVFLNRHPAFLVYSHDFMRIPVRMNDILQCRILTNAVNIAGSPLQFKIESDKLYIFIIVYTSCRVHNCSM